MDSLIKLNGKKGIILGIANEKSIAWGIAEKLSQWGADLAFSYVNDSMDHNVIFCSRQYLIHYTSLM